jgi:hypothetical protein
MDSIDRGESHAKRGAEQRIIQSRKKWAVQYSLHGNLISFIVVVQRWMVREREKLLGLGRFNATE